MPFIRAQMQLEDLADVRRYVQEQAEALKFDPKGIYALILAVDEITANILKYGYHGEPGPVEITVERQGDHLVIHISDQAEIFDPTQMPDPDLSLPLNQRPEGKLGLYLARNSVDQMIHQVDPQGGNILTLKKKGFLKKLEVNRNRRR